MLFSLFAFALSEENKCVVKKISSTATTVGNMGQPSVQLFYPLMQTVGGAFGMEVSQELNTTSGIDGLLPFVLGSITFCLIFLLFFLILFFWMICTQICCCCYCCTPKRGEKWSVCQMVHNLISMSLMIVSGILFLVSAIKLSGALNEILNIPQAIPDAVETVVDTINETIFTTFGFLDTTVGDAEGQLNTLIVQLRQYTPIANKVDDGDIELNLDEFVKYFTPSATVSAPYITLQNDLSNKLGSAIQNPYSDTTKGVAKAVVKSTDEAKKLVTKFKGAKTQVDDALDKANKTLSSTMKNVTDAINQQKGDISGMLSPLSDMQSTLVSTMNPITGIVGSVKMYIELAAYIGTALILLIAVTYGVLFFFNICCTRCMYAWFHCFGFFLNLLIVLPCVIFAAIFIPVFELCPQIPTLVSGFAGGSLNISEDQFTQLLTCEDPTQSIYKLGFDGIIDYQSLIENMVSKFKDQVATALNVEGFTTQFDAFADYNVDEEFTTSTMTGADYYYNLTERIIPSLPESSRSPANTSLTKINNYLHDTNGDPQKKLNDAKEIMDALVKFGKNINPLFNGTKSDVEGLVDVFQTNALTELDTGLNSIKCTTTSCIYAPINNFLCSNLLDAIAIWIISSVMMIIGLILMSVSVCRRRRRLKKIQVEEKSDNDDSYYSEDEDEEKGRMVRGSI